MIQAKFFESDGNFKGFSVSGHAGYAESGKDIVCAAVSSAVQLASNILTDGLKISASVSAKNNVVTLSINKVDKSADMVIAMLKAHLEFISEEFPKKIKITTLEV